MTGFLKKYAIAAAVGLSSLCFVGAAYAVVDSPSSGTFGTLNVPATVSFSGYETASTTLSDAITFSVASESTSGVGAISSALLAHKGWASFATSLWGGPTGGLLVDGAGTQNVDGSWSSSFTYSSLSAGSDYSIHIDGVTLSTGRTDYNGFMTLSPVPEPETFAMMLAGLGLMGFIARRRKQNGAAA